MVRTLWWFLCFWLFQLVSIPMLLLYLLLGIPARRTLRTRFHDWLIHYWAQQMIRRAGVQVEVSGLQNLPPPGGMLFVSNHQGAFDIPLVLGYIPGLRGFISKKENLWLPIVSAWMLTLRCLFIDRRDPRQSARVIARGVERLARGHSLVVFPEGTRSRDGAIRTFKSGTFKLATRANVPIVPLTIDGTRLAYEANHGRIRPARVRLHIHPAIVTTALNEVERNGLAARVQQIVASRLPPAGHSAE